ncbi:MAG: DUF664 domain-containing protein [Marmoricola sp.]
MTLGRTNLLDSLNATRRHVLGILDGLDEDALHRSVLPSGWSPVELVQHLALDVERFWFRQVMAGSPTAEHLPGSLEDLENAWKVPPGTNAAAVIDGYRREIELADAAIADLTLDAAPGWWPDFFGDHRMHSLEEVVLHVIVETAAHAGHLDTVRELIDGRQWMVLTED